MAKSVTKSSAKVGVSAAVLLVSALLSKALGAVFRLPLTNLLGLEGIGVYQLVMSLFSFALVLTSGGVTTSLSKLISSARATGQVQKISVYIRRALLVSLSFSLALGAVFALLSSKISAFQGADGASGAYMLFLLLLPLGAALATLRGCFQGYENMYPTAISQIVEQLFKFAFGLFFAFLFSGSGNGVFGAFLGILASEVCALVCLLFIFIFRREKTKFPHDLAFIKNARREFDRANFPLTGSSAILPLVTALDSLFIIGRLSHAGLSTASATTLYGLQSGVVGAMLSFPLVISMAVTTSLLPNLSYEISRGSGTRATTEKALKILLFLILPTTFGLVAISKPLLALLQPQLQPSAIQTAFNLMLFGGFGVVFTALMQFCTMLLSAHGQFRFLLAASAIGGAAKLSLTLTLAALPSVNIYALVLGNIALPAIVCVLSLHRLRQISAFSIRLSDAFWLLFATIAMFWLAFTFVKGAHYSSIVNIILAVGMGAATYLVFTAPFWVKLKGSFRKGLALKR